MELDELCCFLCKQNNGECTTLSLKLGINSVEEDLMQIYGDAIQQYLHSNHPICLNCAQIVNNMVKLKRRIYEVIVDNAVSLDICGQPSSKAFNFADIWITRSNNLYLYPNLHNFDEHISPNDLLVVTSSVPYDERCDPVGTGSRFGCDTPFLDKEVQRMTSRSKNRRGYRWTHRKSSRSRSNNTSRSVSRHSYTSRVSGVSTTSRNSASSKKKKKLQQAAETQLKRIVHDFFCQSDSLNRFTREYLKKIVSNDDEDNNENGDNNLDHFEISIGRKTRFADGVRNRLLSEYQKLIFECPYNSCQKIMYTLESFTEHRVRMHNEMAMFWCEQCKFCYLTQEHLDQHNDVHFNKFIAYCIYCGEEYTNKRLYEDHLNEHLNHSFPCIYCDKFFLTKQLCENHVRTQHPGKKRKIKRIKPQSILDRIDKNPEMQESKRESKVNNNEDKDFEVRILWQRGQPEEPPRVAEDDLEDVDLALENLVEIGLEESPLEEISSKE